MIAKENVALFAKIRCEAILFGALVTNSFERLVCAGELFVLTVIFVGLILIEVLGALPAWNYPRGWGSDLGGFGPIARVPIAVRCPTSNSRR